MTLKGVQLADVRNAKELIQNALIFEQYWNYCMDLETPRKRLDNSGSFSELSRILNQSRFFINKPIVFANTLGLVLDFEIFEEYVKSSESLKCLNFEAVLDLTKNQVQELKNILYS